MNVQSAMISQFRVSPTSKKWYLKTIQMTIKHDQFNFMYVYSRRLYIHIAFTIYVGPSTSMKWTWTSSAFSTNDSAWSVMVMGSHTHVWNGPKGKPMLILYLQHLGIYNEDFTKKFQVDIRREWASDDILFQHYHLGLYSMQKSSYIGTNALVSIWCRMVLIWITTHTYKDPFILRYTPNISCKAILIPMGNMFFDTTIDVDYWNQH